MKILFFAESLGSGGKERRIVELIKGLSVNNSIEIELVLTKKEIRYEEIFQTKTKIHYLVRRGIKKDPRLFFQFYTIAKKFRPDLIHVWGNLVAIYAIPAKVILKIPMINSQITNANRKSKSKILNTNLTFPFSDKILSNSYAGLLAYKAPEKKSAVIYNGFSFGRIENLPNKYTIREELKIKSDLVVGMVGDYTGNKDYTTYIKAAIEVLKERNDVSFICAGDGDFTKFRDMVINHYKEKIIFLGFQKNIESIMNICDIGILISNKKIHQEGISNALLEFMALGKPVIANDNGGNSELIDTDRNGFILKNDTYMAVKESIISLLDNEKLRSRFGSESKAIVKEKFAIKRMIDLFIQEYVMLMNNNSSNKNK